MATQTFDFEVFFDGACRLCNKEISWLRGRVPSESVRFTDIAAPDFDPPEGVSYDELMARIHGRLPDGTLVEGVEVFRHLYAAAGFKRLVGISRWPGISSALDLAYVLFAKNRLRLTGRCADGQCSIPVR